MSRLLKVSVVVILSFACLCVAWSMGELPLPGAKVPVRTQVANGVVTFTWPVMRGKWNLYERQSPVSGEWTPIDDSLHHTNESAVTVSLPVPKTTTFYLVKRTFHKPAPPPFPQVPAAPPKSTNRPQPNP